MLTQSIKITRACTICGTEYTRVPSWDGPFCSRACAHESLRRGWEERFWSQVEKTDECWFWTGKLSRDGYGRMNRRGVQMFVHRLSWEIHFGDIPQGLDVLHTCDIRRCVRPDDLFLGTHQDNMIDRNTKGRQARGERCGNARFTDDDIREIRRLAAEGMMLKDIAVRFGTYGGPISVIVNRKRWAHVE